MAATATMMRWASHILRLGIAGLFIWAGAVKALDPAAFARGIVNYELVGPMPAAALSLYLPWIEIVAGLALLVNRARAAAMGTLATLMVIFIAAMCSAWWRGLDIDCGCFGGARARAGLNWPILRGLLILVAMGLLAVLMRQFAPKGLRGHGGGDAA